MSDADPINFSTFILGLASTTLIHLGAAPHPETGKPSVDLTLAQQSLSLLEMLQLKTQGNLAAEEARLFANLLTDLRLRFVDVSKSQ